LGENLQNLKPPRSIGHTKLNFSIKSSWSPQGRIKVIWAIGRGNHNHAVSAGEAIHQAQQLSHHSLFDLTVYLGAIGRKAVNFINEDHTRSRSRCFLKQTPQPRLGFSVVFADNFGSNDRDVVYI
jgi:hypothetical protein